MKHFKLLSKRIMADRGSDFEYRLNRGEEIGEDYQYVGWHGPRIHEQADHDRYKNNSYGIFNGLSRSDIQHALSNQREKNAEWMLLQ